MMVAEQDVGNDVIDVNNFKDRYIFLKELKEYKDLLLKYTNKYKRQRKIPFTGSDVYKAGTVHGGVGIISYIGNNNVVNSYIVYCFNCKTLSIMNNDNLDRRVNLNISICKSCKSLPYKEAGLTSMCKQSLMWRNLLSKCENKRATTYRYFGALGYTVCERWKDIRNFIEDMGYIPETGRTVLIKEGCYEFNKDNCYWGFAKNSVRGV